MSGHAVAFDLQDPPPGFLDDPFPTYHRLRQHDPVHRCPDGSYFLTRYDDVAEVYRDHRRLSSDKRVEFRPKFGESPLYEHHTTSLVFRDPPDHTRIRKLFAAAFTPRALAALEPRVVALVDGLLDRAAAQGGMDLIPDYAAALPVQLIGDMLGVPREERDPLRDWSLAILGALEPVATPGRQAAGNRAVEEFKTYLRRLIADRRRRPGGDEGEILGALIAAEDAGDRLTELELLHQCIFLLNAGHETTTNLIGNGAHALLRHPDELARLRAHPDRLDIARAPNRHLAFITGIHACAGMWLARMEGRVAIGRLVARFPDLRPAGPVVRGGRARFRGLASLPVAI
jgi:cytochrome P450